MKIMEQFTLSKTGNQFDCEDLLVFNTSFAAVIDGATARCERLFDGRKAGLTAALITQRAVEKLSESATLRDALNGITDEFIEFYREQAIDITCYDQILTASAILYSRHYHEIWMIGDCQCLVNGMVHTNHNGIDDFVAATRSMINQAEILKGNSIEWVMENDPGSQFINTLLTEQFLFQNLISSRKGSYGYTAIDGRMIHENSVKVIRLDSSVHEIILASDGYPVLCGSLQDSEDTLAEILRNDPLCIYEYKSVKGMKEGLISFDDRAFLRLSI